MEHSKDSLKKDLKVLDLTSMGVAAIIGAGIYSTIGVAASTGGAGVIVLFLITAFACMCSALCYAQFASKETGAGSAYHYAKSSFGMLVAWIIGWDLILEYAIGNTAVAISWSDYLVNFLEGLGVYFPDYLTMDYRTASKAIIISANPEVHKAYMAFQHAPSILGLKIVFDLPALLINILITILVIWGIRESKWGNHLMVAFKLLVILMLIIIGVYYVDTNNWQPFAPMGFKGIMQGASAVFFAYIGFDAISTTAEECENPQKDLPKAILYSLLICTIIYTLVSLVITGMVSYKDLAIGDPLALVFQRHGLDALSGWIAFSAIVSLASVMLVYQIGQPRILMGMSRDRLLPKLFSDIHPVYKTPWKASIVTGLMVALPTLFMNLSEVADLCSIGTLFAFTIVCAGTLEKPNPAAGYTFKVPYIHAQYVGILIGFATAGLIVYQTYHALILSMYQLLPPIFLVIILMVLAVKCFLNKYSLIPFLGIVINIYLMSQMGLSNWIRFACWLLIGLLIYYFYGRKNRQRM